MTTINVELELLDPNESEISAEKIEEDLRKGESQIGWWYDYAIREIHVTKVESDLPPKD